MLTREHSLLTIEGDQVQPDRLTRVSHSRYVLYEAQMLAVYRQGIGLTRRELHHRIRQVFADEPDCPIRRIGAFCKLLDEASEFETDTKGEAAALRKHIFQAAARYHPLVSKADLLFGHLESQVKSSLAAELGKSWESIDAELFRDVIEFHRLRAFNGYDSPLALLARYNVAQIQVALFSATRLTVRAGTDFKTISRYAKLARLMHTIRRLTDGRYEFVLDGPTSILRETRRYGVCMAKFIPALIACREWQMRAEIKSRWSSWKFKLDLSSEDGLKSHLPPPTDFDSAVEEKFAERWGTDSRQGWTMTREGEILYAGQRVFIPDFVFRHADGRLHLLEIVGYWTPEYLQAKIETLRLFGEHPVMLAVAASVSRHIPELPANTILYKTSLKVDDVLEKLG